MGHTGQTAQAAQTAQTTSEPRDIKSIVESRVLAESRALIRRKGYRLTPQRQMILDAVRESQGHCTPDEVFARVQRKNSAVNRATVYRTLDFLLRLGLVTTAHIQNNQVIYELAGHTPHHHLVCQHCNHVIQIDHDLIQPMLDKLEKLYGFEVRTDHFMIFGLCAACRAAEQAA